MSKAATELVTSAWRDSYFPKDGNIRIASARAGNVIGGGDWSEDRIVPDCIRSFAAEKPVVLRNPGATRPWQHVLEPLAGYLLLAAKLQDEDGFSYCGAWNFGPPSESVLPVSDIVQRICKEWGEGAQWSVVKGNHPHEAGLLALNCDKSIQRLGWKQVWNINKTVKSTVDWYREWHGKGDGLQRTTLDQIKEFTSSTSMT
jgi:CDP-glucose 4,6-dehydratase